MSRLAAGLIDLLAALVLAGLLASTTGWYLAERAVATFRIYDPTSGWNGPVPLVLGAVSPLSYGWPFAWLLVTAGEAFWGAGPGKLICGLVVRPLGGTLRSGVLVRRWLGRALGPLVYCVGLVGGWWVVAALALPITVWTVVDSLAALRPGGRSWLDRWAGSSVVTRRSLPAGTTSD